VAAPSLADASLTAGGRIGRYFNIVSMIPVLFLVLWTYALLSTHPWRHTLDFKAAAARLGHWSVVDIGWVLAATLLLALFLHPLQFATTQLLEGYWGSSRLALRLTTMRIRYHRRRRQRLDDLGECHGKKWREQADLFLQARYRAAVQRGNPRPVDDPSTWDEDVAERQRASVVLSTHGDDLTIHVVGEQAVNVQLDNYPAPDRVLPTRLGNTLRAFEDSAGKQYGLDAITTAPHFFLIAPDRHMQYVRDSREQLDIAVKLCTVSLIATVITVALLLPDGLWLLMALAPYSFAYLAYRASIAAAQEHAVAVRTVIDLNRFALYESLGTARPKRTRQERTINQRLMALLQGDDEVSVRYADPRPLPPDSPTTP
jgi:hypothetical protein